MQRPVKPRALLPGSTIAIVSPASAPDEARLTQGCARLEALGYVVYPRDASVALADYFAAPVDLRLAALEEALADTASQAVFFARGGYGSTYLLDVLSRALPLRPKIVLGYSDISSLEIFFWQKLGWVTFYGPMVAAGFDIGPDAPGGYDADSFARAMTHTRGGWELNLRGESLFGGEGKGRLLGGCLTLLEATLGTPWELKTEGAVLLLEDRGMKPYQVDRALMHLKQAGKLKGVRGILLGEFPECDPSESGVTVRDVCQRVLADLKVPVVWGAPIGHADRPMLTLPLGVRARLCASATPRLRILEPAVLA
jgi:muramoyltetrapeptide carboxypeptidase